MSFVHVFKQKGFQLKGQASYITDDNSDVEKQITLIQSLAKDSFPVKGIIVIDISSAKPIIAPGYYLQKAK